MWKREGEEGGSDLHMLHIIALSLSIHILQAD